MYILSDCNSDVKSNNSRDEARRGIQPEATTGTHGTQKFVVKIVILQISVKLACVYGGAGPPTHSRRDPEYSLHRALMLVGATHGAIGIVWGRV